VMAIVDAEADLYSYAGPGRWNDPDMLEVGNPGLTTTESRSHFSMWAILAAPLIAGNDVTKMTPEIREILTNKEVVGVDQDALGRQGQRVMRTGDLEVWSKRLADGSRAVILLNRGAGEAEITAAWTDIGYPNTVTANVRDLWAHKDLGKFTGKFSANVASHGVVMVKVAP
jgi:alpha-galactosidase